MKSWYSSATLDRAKSPSASRYSREPCGLSVGELELAQLAVAVHALHRRGEPVRGTLNEYAVPALPGTALELDVVEQDEEVDAPLQVEVAGPRR